MLCMGTSLWATELPGKATLAFSLATEGTSFGTETGSGTYTYTNGDAVIYDAHADKNKITAGASDHEAWAFAGTSSYIKVSLTNALQAGDVVAINAKYNNSSAKVFRICDDIANNSSGGIVGHGSEITTGSSMADCWVILETGNALIGKKEFYLGWCSGSYSGKIASVKVYQSDAPSTVTATKTWDYNDVYDNPFAATDYQTVNDGMYYSPGISFSSKTEFTGNLLNIQSSGKNDATISESTSKYLKFYVPAGSVQVTVNAIPYGESNKTLYCKVGNQEAEGKDASGKTSATTLTFATKYTTDVTPVYIYAKGTGTVYYIKDITVTFIPAPTVTITEAGWATLYTTHPLDFSSLSANLTAYSATCTGSTVTLTQVNDVPANTGVVLKGAQDTYTIPLIASSSTDKGHLLGSATDPTAWNAYSGYDLYMLVKNNDKAQFKKVTSGSIAAGKAFLKIKGGASSLAPVMNVVFANDNQTTGINNVNRETITNNRYFDLQGRRVANPTKGLYIVNGKKVVIK